MVQIPATFDAGERRASSPPRRRGSRGVYGAIGTAGEWGLKHGCAVAYTDKGTGNGVARPRDRTRSTCMPGAARRRGHRGHATRNFTANADGRASSRRSTRRTRTAVAFKHAHSQQNPEKDWGRDTLSAIRFAFYVLNEQFGDARRRRHVDDGHARATRS